MGQKPNKKGSGRLPPLSCVAALFLSLWFKSCHLLAPANRAALQDLLTFASIWAVLRRLYCGWPHHWHICRHVVSHPISPEWRHLGNVANNGKTPHFLVKNERRLCPCVLPPMYVDAFFLQWPVSKRLTALWTSLPVFFGLAQRDWKCHLFTV